MANESGRLVRIANVLLILAVLAGCQTPGEIRLVCPYIPEVVPPAVPRVTGEELACLSDSAYERLARLDDIRRAHAADLTAILTALQEECKQIESEGL